MQILSSILTILLVILVFNLMILVHELGHYWAARWRGLVVDRFQIWFGKPWLKCTHKGVQWGIGWIPMGGFVSLPQMAPMESIEGKSEHNGSLPPIKPLDKIIVAFAGPLFSFLLAALFALIVSITGTPSNKIESTVIGGVLPDQPAAKAGLQAGDTILEIDGKKINSFSGPIDSVIERITLSTNNPIAVTIQRPGEAQPRTIEVTVEQQPKRWWKRSELRQIGVLPMISSQVGAVMPHSPAALAGVTPGDTIEAINGKKTVSGWDLLLTSQQESPFTATLRSPAGDIREVTLDPRTPDLPENYQGGKKVGISLAQDSEQKIEYPSVGKQIHIAATTIIRTVRALSSSKSGVGVNDLAGPLQIAKNYYELFQIEWRLVLWFSVILNINLAILNMLPLPVLDGGHITLSIIEKLRGKPVSMRVLAPLYSACSLLLFGFMGYKLLQESWLIGTKQDQGQPQETYVAPEFLPQDKTQDMP